MDKTQFAPRNAVINRIETMLKNKAFTITGGYHPYTGYTNHPLILAMQSKLNNHFTPRTFIKAPYIHDVQVEKRRRDNVVVGAMENSKLVANVHKSYANEGDNNKKIKKSEVVIKNEKNAGKFTPYINVMKKINTIPGMTHGKRNKKVVAHVSSSIAPTLTSLHTYHAHPTFKPTTNAVTHSEFGNNYPRMKKLDESKTTNYTKYDIQTNSHNSTQNQLDEEVSLNETEVLPPMSLALKSVALKQDDNDNQTMTNGAIMNISYTTTIMVFYFVILVSFLVN